MNIGYVVTIIFLAIYAPILAVIVFILHKISKHIKGKPVPKAIDTYVDYYNSSRGYVIRVYPAGFDVEAMQGFKPSQIIEAGDLGQFKYYLIQL